MDPNTTKSILELLKKINDTLGVTIVVITHEMRVIDLICDRVAVLDQSRVAEEGKVSEVFINPQSEIAKELILPDKKKFDDIHGGRRIRVTFHPEYSYKPLISEMILECQIPVNILYADMKELDGVPYGQMLIELPDDERNADRIITWLRKGPIEWREEV